MFGAVAGHSAGQHLASVGNITSQDLDIFIVNEIYLVYTESAEFSSLKSFIITQFINSFFIIIPACLKRLYISCFFRCGIKTAANRFRISSTLFL